MKIDDFVKETENYIKDQGWNIPVLVFNDVIRVGIDIPELLPLITFKDYSKTEILEAKSPKIKAILLNRMVTELIILREKLRAAKETEKITKEVNELLKG